MNIAANWPPNMDALLLGLGFVGIILVIVEAAE
jgi:hypothetical protein